MTEKTTDTAPLAPLKVAVIGTGQAVGGPAPLTTGTVAVTPETHQPNLVTIVVSPLFAIVVRAISVFLNTLLGGMGLAGVSTVTAMPSLEWASWEVAITIAAAAALVNVLQNLATIFGKLENKYPIMTGNV